MLTAPRVFFAMARDGVFFEAFADVHPRLLTPHVAILATGAWAAVLSLTGTFEQLATYVVFGQWIFFGLTVAAVIVLRRTRPDLPRPYRTWGYPVTPVVFIAAGPLHLRLHAGDAARQCPGGVRDHGGRGAGVRLLEATASMMSAQIATWQILKS